MINYNRKGCRFYHDEKCPVTERYLKSAVNGKVSNDLISQREKVCNQKNSDCAIRINLLTILAEAI